MKHNVFISYAKEDEDIVLNLKDRLQTLGIVCWVYKSDNKLGEYLWKEIKDKMSEASLIMFVFSKNSANAEGQKKELEIAKQLNASKLFPLVIGNEFSICPEFLRYINGDFLNSYNIKTVSQKIAKLIFPDLYEKEIIGVWKYPTPGEWLEIYKLDEFIENYFEKGDKLYFIAISPMGLFACYSPKIKDIYYISHENVRRFDNIEDIELLNNDLPYKYSIIGMIDTLRNVLGSKNKK
jgi:hypothetical protein